MISKKAFQEFLQDVIILVIKVNILIIMRFTYLHAVFSKR